MQNNIFYAVCFGFIFGVLLRSFVFVNFYFTLFLILISLVVIFYFSLVKYLWGIVGGIFILFFCLGIFRFNLVEEFPSKIFESKVNKKVSFIGKVVDNPIITENNQKLIIEIYDKEKIKILAITNFDNSYIYGDKVNIFGKLEKPENFTNDNGKFFDYINYLKKDGIFYIINYANVSIISRGNGNFLKSFLFSIKEKFLEKINIIQYPENLLLGGLILGEKSTFNESLKNNFIKTGTVHIIALSGYNITIISEWIMKFLNFWKFLPNNFSINFGIFSIFLFVLMTGASSTAIRAGIMAILVLIARLTGRNYDVLRALILAGVFMILINPLVLVFDISFQLSFMSTIALIFFTPKIEKYFMWVTKSFGLRDIVSVTFAVYIFVLPFILYKMGNLSFVALPANILILPFIPMTMFFGFVTGFLGLIWYEFSVPFSFISYLFLHYELSVINFFAQMSFASILISDFPFILVILIYVYFFYLLFCKSFNL